MEFNHTFPSNSIYLVNNSGWTLCTLLIGGQFEKNHSVGIDWSTCICWRAFFRIFGMHSTGGINKK